MTTVENLERMVSSDLGRWFGVPRSLSSVALYSTSAKLQLPFKGLTEKIKVGNVIHSIMLRSSQDEMVRRTRVEVKTGQKWKVRATIQDAGSRLRIGDIVGTVAISRGLGTTSTPRWSKAGNTDRRDMVQTEVRSMEEEEPDCEGSWNESAG